MVWKGSIKVKRSTGAFLLPEVQGKKIPSWRETLYILHFVRRSIQVTGSIISATSRNQANNSKRGMYDVVQDSGNYQIHPVFMIDNRPALSTALGGEGLDSPSKRKERDDSTIK